MPGRKNGVVAMNIKRVGISAALGFETQTLVVGQVYEYASVILAIPAGHYVGHIVRQEGCAISGVPNSKVLSRPRPIHQRCWAGGRQTDFWWVGGRNRLEIHGARGYLPLD